MDCALDLYDPRTQDDTGLRYAQDLGVSVHIYDALTLWHLGFPDQARDRFELGINRARASGHSYTLGYTLFHAAWLHLLCGRYDTADKFAEELEDLTNRHELPMWVGFAQMLIALTKIWQGRAAEGIAQLWEAIEAYEAQGYGIYLPMFLIWLLEAQCEAGETEAGFATAARIQHLMEARHERLYEAELYRIWGELERSRQQIDAAETHYLRAVEVAQTQGNRSIEFRAATGLARLWQSQGKISEASDLLAPIYGWFTEGFDTADLKEAKALLDELS